MTGWNLPPGVSTRDLPGNRPEDEAWDQLIQEAAEDLGPYVVANRLNTPKEDFFEALEDATWEETVDVYEAVRLLIQAWYDEHPDAEGVTTWTRGMDLRAALWPVRGRLRRALEGIGINLEALHHGEGLNEQEVEDLLQKLANDIRGALDHIEGEGD